MIRELVADINAYRPDGYQSSPSFKLPCIVTFHLFASAPLALALAGWMLANVKVF